MELKSTGREECPPIPSLEDKEISVVSLRLDTISFVALDHLVGVL